MTEGLVVAVDPADLSVEGGLPENVVFLKGKAQEVLEEATKLGPYNVIVRPSSIRPSIHPSVHPSIRFIYPLE